MFALLPQLYSRGFLDFFIRNYFRFLYDTIHKWLDNFDNELFYNMINKLDPDLKLIFKKPAKSFTLYFAMLKMVRHSLKISRF